MLRTRSGIMLPESTRGLWRMDDENHDPRTPRATVSDTGRPADLFVTVGRNLHRHIQAAKGHPLAGMDRVANFRQLMRDGLVPRLAGGARVYYRQYQEPAGFTMIAAQSAITGTSEALMWPYQFSAIPAQALVPGQQVEITATGIATTAASSPGTLTINPRWGTTTSGVTMGISNTSPTLATSLTGVAWYLKFTVTVRTVSDTATSSTVFGTGFFVCQAIGSATAPGTMVFGGTPATVDTVSAEGIVFGAILGSASDSITTESVSIEVLN